MIVRDIVAVIAESITSTTRGAAHLLEMLADAVEDDHRLVHRVAKHREHRGQHRERNSQPKIENTPTTRITSCRLAMIAATANFHSKRKAR